MGGWSTRAPGDWLLQATPGARTYLTEEGLEGVFPSAAVVEEEEGGAPCSQERVDDLIWVLEWVGGWFGWGIGRRGLRFGREGEAGKEK